MYGRAARDSAIYDGFQHLKMAYKVHGDEPNSLCLVWNLKGIDPDDYYSSVPYEKGSFMLVYLERVLLRDYPSIFHACMHSWLTLFTNRAASSEDWKQHFCSFMSQYPNIEPLLESIDWKKWYHSPELPDETLVFPHLDLSQSQAPNALAQRWISGQTDIESSSMEEFDARSVMRFLDHFNLPSGVPVTLEQWKRLTKVHEEKLGGGNCEIRFRRLVVGLRLADKDVLPEAAKFLSEQGRMKYVRPLFRAMLTFPLGEKFAQQLFAKIGKNYMPICAKMVAQDLKKGA